MAYWVDVVVISGGAVAVPEDSMSGRYRRVLERASGLGVLPDHVRVEEGSA